MATSLADIRTRFLAPTAADGRGFGVAIDGQGDRLSLDVRRLKLEHEIAGLRLPADLRELLDVWVQWRQAGFEAKYMAVAVYRRLVSAGEVWRAFGASTLRGLLDAADLPDDRTLDDWAEIVDLFSRETYLLVGHDSLRFMVSVVSRYQKDEELRRRDYRAIFDAYAAQYPTLYEQTAFRLHVHGYVSRTYVSALHVLDRATSEPSSPVTALASTRPARRSSIAARRHDLLLARYHVAVKALREINQAAASNRYGVLKLGDIASEALREIGEG